MDLPFTPAAWADYQWWIAHDKKMAGRINRLINEVLRNPTEGIGKPEKLRYGLADSWSRRITEEHRLVYTVAEAKITILSVRYHYE